MGLWKAGREKCFKKKEVNMSSAEKLDEHQDLSGDGWGGHWGLTRADPLWLWDRRQ